MDLDTPTPKKKTTSLLEEFNKAHDAEGQNRTAEGPQQKDEEEDEEEGLDDEQRRSLMHDLKNAMVEAKCDPHTMASAASRVNLPLSDEVLPVLEPNFSWVWASDAPLYDESTASQIDQTNKLGYIQGIFQLLIITGNWATKSMWWEAVAEELLVRGTATRINCESNARTLIDDCIQRNPNFEKDIMAAGIARMLTTNVRGGEPAVRRPKLDAKLWSMKQAGQMVYKGLIGPKTLRSQGRPCNGPLADLSSDEESPPPLVEDTSPVQDLSLVKDTSLPKTITLIENTLPVGEQVIVKTSPLAENMPIAKPSPLIGSSPVLNSDAVAMSTPMARNTLFAENTFSVGSTFRDEGSSMDEDMPTEGNISVMTLETKETVVYQFQVADDDTDL
ncbi:hypothetical protein TWF696_008678 [Orbilia brochopaga]|uniref:Uncharacterized protein n=1 Tax=Orbilia brochopaga TaxID=3140254 RepID=A0AAV9UIL6_9PEZI